ncbi:MAG: PASTA domain-containing protein [Sedimentisphaerales bacterium]|nr:PASTA domain-containing protein [Sedimentisphaerales bacterium]
MVLRERLMKKYAGIMMVSLMLTAVGSMQVAYGEEFAFRQGEMGYSGCMDECIHESGYIPNTRLRMQADYPSGDEEYNTLIRFDISEISQEETVVNATLTLTYQDDVVEWVLATLDIYPCLRAWESPDWIHAISPDVDWSVWGAQGMGTDRGNMVTDYCMEDPEFPPYSDNGQFEIPLPNNLVQGWVDDPCSNHGIIIVMNPVAATVVCFSSSEDVAEFRPLLTINTGVMVEVPDVVGMSQVDAVIAIAGADLDIGEFTEDYHDTIPIGYVMGQSPEAWLWVPEDTPVDMVLSLGPELIPVPDVVELSHTEAVLAILNADLTLGTVGYDYHPTLPKYYVISQDPCAGYEVEEGTPVHLTESLGEQPLPDFNGDYITNLIDFNQLASEWMSCDPCVVTTDMTADGCVQVDDLALLVKGWLQYHCKNRPEADISGNCCVDMEDLAILLSEWLTCDEENIANIDGDGEGCVNLPDLSVLSSQWGLCGEAYEP